MLDPGTICEIAARLDAAERSGVQVSQLSLQHPSMTVEDGYGIQREWVARKLAAGRSVKGHKIGLTSRAMQRSSQIDEPDHGVLLDDMFFQEGSDIPFARFIEPRVEVELAFILSKELAGPNCSVFDVLSATAFVVPAIEIIDARIQRVDPATRAPRKVADTIADNAANAGVVLGGRPVRADSVDLRWVSALCHQNGVIEETGVAAAVLNHPAHGIAWLANKLARFETALQPSQIILAGSFTRPVAAARGDSFHVDYGGLGSVAFRFV
jgi:2-oxo-hept-3-ene-1,7-dioate hydratase